MSSKMCEGKTDDGDPCSFKKKAGHRFCGIHVNKYSKWNNELRSSAFELNGSLVFPRTVYANAEGMFLICDIIGGKLGEQVHINIMNSCKIRRLPWDEVKQYYIEVMNGS